MLTVHSRVKTTFWYHLGFSVLKALHSGAFAVTFRILGRKNTTEGNVLFLELCLFGLKNVQGLA